VLRPTQALPRRYAYLQITCRKKRIRNKYQQDLFVININEIMEKIGGVEG
jgi:hypothetical protein